MSAVTIAQIRLFSFRMPLVRPLILKGNTVTRREGYAIRLVDHDGHAGWGEVSPLPGFSRESPADTSSQLLSLKSRLSGQTIPYMLEQLDGGFDRWLGEYNLSPSVRFGIEMAVLNLTAAFREIPLHSLLNPSSRPTVSVNALLSGSPDDVFRQAEQACKDGYRAVKLKVGRAPVDDEIKLTKCVCDKLDGTATLRLDANQAWSLDEAITFANGIAACKIEYIEEPCHDATSSRGFANRTGLPVALDESLQNMAPESLGKLTGIMVVILKPTLLDGVERSMRFAREARRLGIIPLISSSFESSLGILALAHLASATSDKDVPTGLGTLSWFERDILQTPLTVSSGIIQLGAYTGKMPEPDTTMLTEVHGV